MIITIHGVGGLKYETSIARIMIEHAQTMGRRIPVSTFPWEAPRLTVKWGGKDWHRAKDAADDVVEGLAARIVQESARGRVYLVAHSLGCRVALGALERLQLGTVEATFLLAAAVDREIEVEAAVRSCQRGLLNYYSSKDRILRRVYEHHEGPPAAGRVGLNRGHNTPGVLNMRVTCGHWRYKQVVQAVYELIEYWERKEDTPTDTDRGGGPRVDKGVFWNEILTTPDHALQRHTMSKNYRVLDRNADSQRLGWGGRLAPLMGFFSATTPAIRWHSLDQPQLESWPLGLPSPSNQSENQQRTQGDR